MKYTLMAIAFLAGALTMATFVAVWHHMLPAAGGLSFFAAVGIFVSLGLISDMPE